MNDLNEHYILDEDHNVKAVDFEGWWEWTKTAYETKEGFEDKCRVAQENVGDVRISTVFLGTDHRFGDSGPPIVFETMVFGGAWDQEQERYSAWDEAVTGHDAMVARVKYKDMEDDE